MSHILYIGYYTDDRVFYEILSRKINNMSIARQNFETNLLRSMIKLRGDEIDFLTYAPTDGIYQVPLHSVLCGQTIRHIPINKKSAVSLNGARRQFQRFLFESIGEENLQGLRVVMYDINPVFMSVLLRLRKKYGITITTICAELPQFRRGRGLQSKIKKTILNLYARKFDRYVLFAEPMAEELRCQNKPHIVVEGIAPELFGTPDGSKKNIVMYAGGLAKDNNIRLLVEACARIDEIEELRICGVGPEQDWLEEQAQRYPWLKYYGMRDNDEVRRLECESKVLVNLRSPGAVLTNYSFPSKILEYMASGTAAISTRLGGIPSQYFDYLIPTEAQEDALTYALRRVFSMESSEYIARVRAGQSFIQNEKNADIQAKKILDLVDA